MYCYCVLCWKYRPLRYCIVLYCVVSYRIVSYRIVSYRIVLHQTDTFLQGVICMSAVYDLTPLHDTFLTRHLYLLPTFGSERRVWLQASPMKQLTTRRDHYVPPFLVVTARWDFSLNDQADDFLRRYHSYNGRRETSRHVIPCTNHLDIVWRFTSHRLLQTACLGFVNSVVRRLDISSDLQPEDDHTLDREHNYQIS